MKFKKSSRVTVIAMLGLTLAFTTAAAAMGAYAAPTVNPVPD